MNIYSNLNKVIEYIEQNLENKIEYSEIAKILGVNEYTLKKVFSIICDVSLPDYIRKRRLSNAGQDLCIGNERIIDIAIKYQYNNPTSFSRAFEKFHGIVPSQVKKHSQDLKIYTKFVFDENIQLNEKIDYSIIEKNEIILYGKCKQTSLNTIKQDAPKFYTQICNEHGKPDYGMVVYKDELRKQPIEYWILYKKNIKDSTKYIIPKSKWIQFVINSQKALDIQTASDVFYKKFLTSCKYNLRNLPELEYYHDKITEFLIPIEN